jgi:hypothetical protein
VNIYYNIFSIIPALRHVSEEMWWKIKRNVSFQRHLSYSRAVQKIITRNASCQGMCHGYQIVTSTTVAAASGKVNDNFHVNGTMFSIAVVHIMNCCFFLHFLIA